MKGIDEASHNNIDFDFGAKKYSCAEKKLLIELSSLLDSSSFAVSLYDSITCNVTSKSYLLRHLRISVQLMKHHKQQGEDLKLSTFQNSLADYLAILSNSKKASKQVLTIVKKVYRYIEAQDYFECDYSSEAFCIFDFCPLNANDVNDHLNTKLTQNSPRKEITDATKIFIKSKNVEKNYLRCFAIAFSEISKVDANWSTTAIRQGIQNYRDNYDTENGSLNTKYHEVSRVIELFLHLKTLGLIDRRTVFPKNISKPSNSNLMRSTNPTISSINVDLMSSAESMSSAQSLVDMFYTDLKSKLDCIVRVAKEVVLNYFNNIDETEIEKQDGMSAELIVAMQIIIVDEIGINPTPLYYIKVGIESGERTKHEFIIIDDDGSMRINVIKWRQRRLQKKTSESSAFQMSANISRDDINTSFCIQFALLLTETKRKRLKTNLLWITDIQTRINKKVTFDKEFRKFCDKYLPHDIAKLKPTLMRIRSSRAMEIYISSDGNVVKTASYLGNKVKTTLSTYIPNFLQEVIYRRKISVFQHLYLVLATANEANKEKLLGMTHKQYNEALKEIYENEDFGGPLFELIKPQPKDNDKDKDKDNKTEIFFVCSAQNFAFAIKTVKTCEDKTGELYKVCLSAINKASSGSFLYKKMILEAEEILEKDDFFNE